MPKFSVYATVTGSKYLGDFEADTKEAAIEQAEASGAAWVSLCHQCDSECEDPQAHDLIAEEA
jgi:hypothetical protein